MLIGKPEAPRGSAAAFAIVLACALGIAPAFGNGNPEEAAPQNADYEIAVSAIKAKDWDRALYHLNIAAKAEPANADIQTELGYTYRNQKKFDLAFKHYNDALRLNPAHRGAHEYIGEAFVLVGDKPKAREHLAALERICGKQCEEYEDLQKAIETAK